MFGFEKPIIVCVYRSGGDFKPEDVSKLMIGIEAHVTVPHTTMCLTDKFDDVSGVDRVEPMLWDWPKWWGKMELFRDELFMKHTQIFYMDLDTVIIGNIDELLSYRGNMCMLNDFHKVNELGSALMSWKAGFSGYLYNIFQGSPYNYMQKHQGFRQGIGDQGFIRSALQMNCEKWQKLFPGQVVSYKVHCKEGVPEEARIVCFHGRPRPSTLDGTWLQHYNKEKV